jgi:pilus assembly protein CpaE
MIEREVGDRPIRVELVGEEQKRAQVKAVLMTLSDPPLEIAEVARQDSFEDSAALSADVTMAIFNGDKTATLDYLRAHAEQRQGTILFALLHERSPAAMRRALQAGADELLFLPLESGHVTRALLKIKETQRKADRKAGGVICSIVSNIGGVGVTSLAGNLALALLYTLHKRVALVDLHLQTAGLSVYLDLEVGRTIMQLCETERKLDSTLLESALTKHTSGLFLLAAPVRIEDSELIPEKTIDEALNLMRQLFDFVIVDCGSYIDAKTVAAWERSHHLFYLIDQSIGAARCAGRFLDLFARLGLSSIELSFILNKYVQDHPIGEDSISATLGELIYAKLPYDAKVLEKAELRARDLWQTAPGSMLARAIDDLARKLSAGDQAPVVPKEGLVSRLLSVVGART